MSLGLTEELLAGTPEPREAATDVSAKTGPDAAPPSEKPPPGSLLEPVKPISLGLTDELLAGPSLRAGPAQLDKSQVEDIADDPKRAVPLSVVLKSAFFPDEEKKLRYFAQETGIPRERWGVVDGNIVYADPTTNRYVRAIPSVSKAQNPIDLWQRATKWAADQVGSTVPGAVGGAAGVMAGPTPASIPIAAAAAGGTDVARQAVGNMMLKDQPISDIDWLNVLGQGAMSAGPQTLASGTMRAASRNPLRISAYDRKAAMDPETLVKARQAQAQAFSEDVPLSFGQSTGLPSALAAERQLGRDPAAMDTMGKFYDEQRGQLSEATRRYIDSISPVQSVDEGVTAARRGAQDVIAREIPQIQPGAVTGAVDQALGAGNVYEAAAQLSAQRSGAARPLYEMAFSSPKQVWSERIGQMIDDPIGQDALKRGVRIQQLEALARGEKFDPQAYGIQGFNEAGDPIISGTPNLRLLDSVKRGFDDIIEGYRDKTSRQVVLDEYGRAVNQVRGAYRGALDEAAEVAGIPEYRQARQAWAGPSEHLDALEDGRKFLQMDPEQIAQRLAGLSDSGREAYRLGAARSIKDIAAQTPRGGDAGRKVLSSDYVQSKLGALFETPDQFRTFIGQVTPSPTQRRLLEGSVGKLADGTGTEKIGEIKSLFNVNSSNPKAVGEARAAFVRAGREDDWNAMVATHLRDTMQGASKGEKGLSATRLQTSLYADPRQRELFKSAMTPLQYDGFNKIMNVVQNVARTLPEGSPTATDVAGSANLRRQFGSKAQALKSAINMQIGDALFDKATMKMSDAGMAKLAKAVTDPENVEQLKKLRMFSHGGEQASLSVAHLLGISVPGLPDADKPPAGLKAP